jgi:putative transposase
MNIPLEEDRYYHIYNRANGSEKIFVEKDNYRFFMDKYRQHISPIADTYCYCLMPNHFHFLIKIKTEAEVRKALLEMKAGKQHVSGFAARPHVPGFESGAGKQHVPGFESDAGKQHVPGFESDAGKQHVPGFENLGRVCWSNEEQPLEKILSKQLSNFFNSYSKAFNKQQNRMGSLFIKNFKRKKIEDMRYMKNLVRYIHNNPVEAKLVHTPEQFLYSSYNTILNIDNSFLKSSEVIEWFEELNNFIDSHSGF